ncbi:MAG: hypothetical protein ACM3KE_01455 [Hyphomicrobiales bacterium]
MDILGDRLIAIAAESPVRAHRESREAAEIAEALGVRHIRVRSGEFAVPDFVANPRHWCYICKQHVFGEVIRIAAGENPGESACDRLPMHRRGH